ncbi:hypothetical protein V8E36_007256 [Tilletia maclaganii]
MLLPRRATLSFPARLFPVSKGSRDQGTEQRCYHGTASSIYALPAENHEYDRLEKQHRLILHLFDGPISAPASLHTVLDSPGAKVLDVGCGPGSWIKLVANKHPKAEAHATEFAPTFAPEEAGATGAARVKFQLGNVLHKLPYDDDTFDLVQMRFLTGALKTQEWPQAIAELRRITKPGGWVQLVEPDGELRTHRYDGITGTIMDWNDRGMCGSLRKRGGEPNAGINLAQYAREAGFVPVSIHSETRIVPLSLRSVDNAHNLSEQEKEHQRRLARMMIDDYHELIRTLAPILYKSWDISEEEMVAWGTKVIEDTEIAEAYHGFVTCVAQK